MSYQNKINLLLAGIIALVVIIGISTFRITQSLLDSGDKVFHTQEVLRATSEVLTSAQDIETGARGFVLTGDSAFLEPFTEAGKSISAKVGYLRTLLANSPSQVREVDSLQKLIGLRIVIANNTIATRNDSGYSSTEKLAVFQHGKDVMDRIRKLINGIELEETTSLSVLQKDNSQEGRSFEFAFAALLTVILITLVTVFVLTKRNSVFRNNAEKLLKSNLDEISNFKTLFESAPGLFLILLPDLTIDAVSDEYLSATMTTREGIIGRKLFDVFPDNPDDLSADGTFNLRASLNTVLTSKKTHRMAVQKYDIQNPDGTFVVRYWSPLNKPVLDKDNQVVFLIHSVEDVTIKLQQDQAIKDSVKEISDYKFALDQAGIVAITDKRGVIKYANDKLCQISQYDRSELIGQDHRIFNSGYHSKEFMQDLWKTISKGNLWKGEIKNRAKDGTEYWVDTSIVPFLDDNGKPFQYVAIRFDITKQKEQQEQLRQQTEELRVQQEELEEANAELEAQTRNLMASEEELKVQHEELIEINHELEEKGRLLEEINHTVNGKNAALQVLSEELQNKAEELAVSSKYKSEFLANMSHELRTPLNSILLLSKLLEDNEDKALSKEQIEFAAVIYRSGKGLLELINDILDLSKIESGKMDVDFENVEVQEICKNMLDIFKPIARERGIAFQITTEGEIDGTLKTDRIRIEQVLKNFLSNAFKFTEKGTVDLILRKPDDDESDQLKIDPQQFIAFEVKDSGIGIPEDKHSMIFEAFQQADGSTRRKYGGTGLGLSISREIAKILGGGILLKSESGVGSSFTIIVPRDSSEFSQIGLQGISNDAFSNPLTDNGAGEIVNTIYDTNVVLNKPDEIPDDRSAIGADDKAILIVEDDTTFAQVLVNHIHEQGYKAIVAVSGGDALAFAVRFNPIGILLDIQLPVKSGWTVMKELKGNQFTKHIPVYMMSSQHINTRDAINVGAIDFMNKHETHSELGKALARIEKTRGKIPKKVLLVDDNEIHTTAISRFISSNEIVCIAATAAQEAHEILRNDDIDCIILDMGLPDINGYELLESIKQDITLQTIPVIIYTGQSLSLSEERKLRRYAQAVIIKTADSFKRLASEVSLFLHQVETSATRKIAKKPYLSDKILVGKHVLIVDDDVRNIFSLTRLLEGQKMKVSAASDGIEALEVLKNEPDISLVLMDMMMPNKDGYDTTREIRKDPGLINMPVIAVTAKAMLGDRDKCIKAGASDYVTKPVDGDQLISLLRVWLF